MEALLICGNEPSPPFRYQRHRPVGMTKRHLLAVSGTPGVGKTQLCQQLGQAGWSVHSLAALAEEHGCLGDTDEADGAAPIDIHRLADEWEGPETGLHAVDGHLAHFLDVDGVVLLRCHPETLRQRLAGRRYSPSKVQANAEWELMAGHWSELLEFELDVPVLELDAGAQDTASLLAAVIDWVADGLASEPLEEAALSAIDWLEQSPS